MEDLSRTEYPAMLANLHPSQAVQTLQDRVKRINKLNLEVADWLQERRKVEETYVQGLRKLLLFKHPNPASELGVFQGPWDRVLQAADAIAASHHLYAQRIERDLEMALRGFQSRKEIGSLNTMTNNLTTMARELDDARDKSDKASRKSGKGAAQKADAAAAKLDSATQQWESQAPFIFETLQSVDELRINHLRDVLTQLQTHEVDQATRTQSAAEEALNMMLEINTAQEVMSFAHRVTAGKPKVERRATRQSSITPSASLAPPTTPGGHEDNASEHSGKNEQPTESKLRSRIGTMLGRRRQSIHGGFGQISPAKNSITFGRLGSSHGRTISPRASSHNLAESTRLSSLAETPDTPPLHSATETKPAQSHEGTNGVGGDAAGEPATPAQSGVNGRLLTAEEIFDAPAEPAPQQKEAPAEAQKDSEGFTVPPAMNDPISQAQKEAGVLSEEGDQLFKLNIKNEPVAEEDADAKQAAMASVASSLSLSMPSRKGGTVRGRRDVRHTIYVPPPVTEGASSGAAPVPSPALPSQFSKPSAVAALASEASIAGTSDTQSVRSATSLGSLVHFKHPDMHGPGLNSSIIESISATFEGEELKAVRVSGEIAFSYNPSADTPAKESETIRINNFSALEAIGPNRIFVQHAPSPDEFTLDTSHIPKTQIGFTYRAHGDSPTSLASQCPLQISAMWKPIGDKLGLVIQYRRHPTDEGTPAALHNVVFVATYEGARASGAQTKPSGTHLKDKHLLYWRLGDVSLSKDWSKIICRVIGDQGAEPKPGHVEVRWERVVSSDEREAGVGISVSRLEEKGKGKGKEKAEEEEEDDPFADEDAGGAAAARRALEGLPKEERGWVDVPLVKKIVSGRYEARRPA